jgi:RNA polymerase sigma-70 factor (ECF subfamily)
VPRGIESLTQQSQPSRQAADIEIWITQARQGNREALGRLLDTCRNYLLLLANQKLATGLQAKVAPSDIVQESLLEAGRDFPRFQGGTEEEWRAWLRGILLNNVANVRRHFKTEKRHVAREMSLAETPLQELQQRILDPEKSPSSHAIAREWNEQLEQALRQLPEHYRQVFLLRTLDGLTFVQIAERLGSTAEAVRKLWGRAVEELAKRLDAPDELT